MTVQETKLNELLGPTHMVIGANSGRKSHEPALPSNQV
jgi:hypothetical protein